MTVQTVHGKNTQETLARSITQHRKKIVALIPRAISAEIFYINNSAISCGNTQVSISIYRPHHIKGQFPTIIYIPGTAFTANSPAYTQLVCSHVAQKSRCQVIAVDLPLAPEYQFPDNIYIGYAAIKYLLNLPAQWSKIELNKVALLGYSSGGNFAASIGMLAKADRLPITKLVLISPWLDLSCSVKGFEKHENKDKTLPAEFLEWVLGLYVPTRTELNDPLLSPLWQAKNNLQHLPQTDIFVGEYDRFRGDSEVFHQSLLTANVSANKFIVSGGDHSFWWQQIETVQAIALRLGTLLNSTPPRDKACIRSGGLESYDEECLIR